MKYKYCMECGSRLENETYPLCLRCWKEKRDENKNMERNFQNFQKAQKVQDKPKTEIIEKKKSDKFQIDLNKKITLKLWIIIAIFAAGFMFAIWIF